MFSIIFRLRYCRIHLRCHHIPLAILSHSFAIPPHSIWYTVTFRLRHHHIPFVTLSFHLKPFLPNTEVLQIVSLKFNVHTKSFVAGSKDFCRQRQKCFPYMARFSNFVLSDNDKYKASLITKIVVSDKNLWSMILTKVDKGPMFTYNLGLKIRANWNNILMAV